MAMSSEQLLPVEAAPVEEETLETAALPIASDKSDEHAAALTPTTALVDPNGGLTIDTDTETLAQSPTRRASVRAASPPRDLVPQPT